MDFHSIAKILLHYHISGKLLEMFFVSRILLCHGISLPKFHHTVLPEFYYITAILQNYWNLLHYMNSIGVSYFCYITKIPLNYWNYFTLPEFHYVVMFHCQIYHIRLPKFQYFTRILLH